MTTPDMRDSGIEPPIKPIGAKEVGYVCATIIILAMLAKDGVIALSAASAVAGAMVGIEFGGSRL